MKILMINSVSGIGSTGRICTDLSDILIKYGHECRIVYGREKVPEKYKSISYRVGTEFDVKKHALASRIFDRAGFYSKKYTEKLIEYIDEYSPDIIHLHNIHGYYINIEVLFDYLAKSNIPVVWTLHDCWSFTGHCSHFDMINCNRWKNECNKCPQKQRYPSSFFSDNSKRNFQQKKKIFTSVKNMVLVTPSKWLSSLVKESFLKDYPVKVINNGIDLDIFKPTFGKFKEKYNLQDKKIILGVASVWDERKGLNDFLKLSEVIDFNTRIVLIGVSKKQIKMLPDNVIGIERTNNTQELAEIYTSADVFLNPSKEETMGLTTVEAMACGTPVLVSNLTAVPEVVTDVSGLVLETMTHISIKENVDQIMNMKFNPRDNALKYEKKEKYLDYLKLYSEIYQCNNS